LNYLYFIVRWQDLQYRITYIYDDAQNERELGGRRDIVERLEANLRYSLVEALALDVGNLLLEGGRQAGTSGASERARAPRRAAMDLLKVGLEVERVLVAERDEEDTVVCKGGLDSDRSRLLAATGGGVGDEDTRVLASERARGPELASRVPESLPLCREVSVTGRDTEEVRVVLREGLRGSDGEIGLGGRMHLGEDLLREGLSDLVASSRATSRLDALLYGVGQDVDVAVHGVGDDSNPGGHSVFGYGSGGGTVGGFFGVRGWGGGSGR